VEVKETNILNQKALLSRIAQLTLVYP